MFLTCDLRVNISTGKDVAKADLAPMAALFDIPAKFDLYILFFIFFFARWVPTGTPGLRSAGPLPHTSHLNS